MLLNKTIDEGKAYLRENFDKGADCPCCGQFVKLYKRKLNSSMAAILIEVYKAAGKSFVHVPSLIVDIDSVKSNAGGGDFAKLEHWGLIQSKKGLRGDGCRHNGYFRITDDGEQFLKGEKLVASHVLIFDGKFQGYSKESVSIRGALGVKFNFSELMRGV